jgi:lipopolysaccharide biosynthesis protein
MFNEMDVRDCDFWGHCRYVSNDNWVKGHRLVDHLMSYFLVARNKILSSKAWREYWDTLLFAFDYQDAVIFHENRFTRFFETRGFVSSEYMPRNIRMPNTNFTVYYAYTQLVKYRSPFLKRKALTIYNNKFEYSLMECSSNYAIIEYIEKHTNYNARLIVQNILRTCISEIHFNYGNEKSPLKV